MGELQRYPFHFSFRKMFGEYCIYLNFEPAFLICDDTLYVKQFKELKKLLKENEREAPFKGAKEWFVLDVENSEILEQSLQNLAKILPKYHKKTDKNAKNSR